MQANVKWFDSRKGYGFIEIPEQADLFLHIKNIVSGDYPNDGDLVEFEFGNDERSGRAVAKNVQVLR